MLYCVYNVFGIYTAHVSRGTIHLIPKGREFSLPLDPRRYNTPESHEKQREIQIQGYKHVVDGYRGRRNR